jgi:CRISPR-associated protein Csm5
MKLKTVYDVTISLFTPLHIGSGAELRRDFDYVTYNRRTWVMNADAFLAHLQKPDGSFDDRIVGRPASELLKPEDYQPNSGFFRYVLPGTPRSDASGAVLREQVKDAFDRPYLPGSSIKGALRTVLAWHGFKETNQQLDVQELGYSRSWAGQKTERAIFGRNPNYDLLRALHVADSETQDQDRLLLVNAQVFTGGDKPGAPIELESIRQDTTFTTTITIDEHQHSPEAERQLRHGNRWDWLHELSQIAQRYALERTQAEMQWYQQRKYSQVAGFYGQMVGALSSGHLGPNRFLLQIGWGGGWASKTIGAPLMANAIAWERLLGDKRLSPARMRRSGGSEFPKSRRSVSTKDTPAAPFGWCMVEMRERQR